MYFNTLLQMSAEISLLVVILLVLMVDIFAPRGQESKIVNYVAIGLLLLHTVLNIFIKPSFELSGGMYVYAPMHTVIKSILNIGTLLIFLSADSWLKSTDIKIRRGEFYVITLSTLLGMYFMISAGNFILFFIGIETVSIPTATLVAFDKYKNHSAEAGAKYIISAVFATAVSIFGLSLLYGATGTLYFSDMSALITSNTLVLIGFSLFAVGMFFKLSLVPFHMWTPDVYEGAPANVTAYLSVISKGAAAFVIFTLFTKVFVNIIDFWQPLLFSVIIISITIANLFAIRQQNIKRFFAYSSISQAGYLMLGVISGNDFGLQTMVYYILIYMFSNLAAFGVISVVEHMSGKLSINDYNGLYKTNPKLSIILMLSLFSLAGIPPFAGFFSKFFIFSAAIQQGFYVLVFIALINTIVSLYYYLIIVKAMFLKENDAPIPYLKNDIMSKTGLLITTLAVIGMGIWSFFMDLITAVK